MKTRVRRCGVASGTRVRPLLPSKSRTNTLPVVLVQCFGGASPVHWSKS